jgi:hypothetical protein
MCWATEGLVTAKVPLSRSIRSQRRQSQATLRSWVRTVSW